jgi:Transcriptional regulatory protein, C terminal
MSTAFTLSHVISRAANEGVPIAAIARIVEQPFEETTDALRLALERGEIGEMPKADWPPAAKWSERLPSTPRSANAEDVEFQCRKAFKLTNLEAGFLMVLLRFECADKERLHNVIEQQRTHRANQPDSMELTDPKMVDVMICKLRKKLRERDFPDCVQTSWGKGYYIEPATKQKIFALIGGPYACGPEVERGGPAGHPA